MVTSSIIIVAALITAIMCIIVVVLYWHRFVRIHWLFFVTMTIGALIIGKFHWDSLNAADIIGHTPEMIRLSLNKDFFVLVTTSILCFSAILYHRIVSGRDG